MEPRARASPEQFSILLDFMERHGDLSKPQQGPQGRIKSERLWVELSNILNSLGGGCKKSSEKWKKVWADWKTKTKKKKLTLSRHASSTGGGPNSRIVLTALEERVVAILGVSAVVGQPGIEEHHGLNRTSNEPALESGCRIEPVLGTSIALGDHSQSVHNIINSTTPESSGIRRLPQSTHPSSIISPRPLTPPLPPPTPSPLPLTPPPHSSQTQPPSIPPRNNRQQAADSPRSSPSTPRRALLRARRNRGLTPFERATQEFAAVEHRRLRYEEARHRHYLEYEEARDKRLHDREMERLRLEAQRIEVTQQQNELLHQLGLLAQRLIDVLTQPRQFGSLPSTDPI